MKKLLIVSITILLILFSFNLAKSQNNDLLLVLAIDNSNSISEENYRLQMQGYAEALLSPDVQRAFSRNVYDRILLIVFEWSDIQTVIIPCTELNTETRHGISRRILEHRRSNGMYTYVGNALYTAQRLGNECITDPASKVLDISSDGVANGGMDVEEQRYILLNEGWTINALAIESTAGLNITEYYENRVQGGLNSFTFTVTNFNNFMEMLRRKLVIEITER